jgi:hypothetical protein
MQSKRMRTLPPAIFDAKMHAMQKSKSRGCSYRPKWFVLGQAASSRQLIFFLFLFFFRTTYAQANKRNNKKNKPKSKEKGTGSQKLPNTGPK